jgi:predicted signal transduction protein with EAL and GGDEF domain
VAIGEFVLQQACSAAVEWHRAHPELAPVPVSVNLSLRQVRQPGLPDIVGRILADTGLPPTALHLEITESVLMQDTDTSMRCLHALKALGASLVLDDFGTGYSSLAYVSASLSTPSRSIAASSRISNTTIETPRSSRRSSTWPAAFASPSSPRASKPSPKPPL